MVQLVLVAAVSENGVIGKDYGLPWRIRADLRRFRALTLDKPVVMGHRTWDGLQKKPLDRRTNIVVTRNREIEARGAEVAYSLEEALRLAEIDARERGAGEICVIGGGEIFREAILRADRLYVSHVEGRFDGDTTFPEIDPAVWVEVSREELPESEGDTARAAFVIYDRRR
jgi:dihydrofolate reductase